MEDIVTKPLKKYNFEVPDRLKGRYKEIYEYLLSCHYEDGILSAGACAFVLGVSKFDFQTGVLYKYGIDYTK